ncbi:LysR family transcriptional regulator [Mesorhizobium sp. CO1-1-11]|uniref:LysR family transcriptional regulator n=1 Tax=Mesorhizobium sp. CO1-1-11 TaxID=2876636 RepID=UPI001CCBCE25|nr:LysR family transcriptional regulator [Mesorhizobium sp. CO1-1-11]MBZ9726294.1 LysR family transcriptional regulator [Mesorhizobium sp. CO1-1-11]
MRAGEILELNTFLAVAEEGRFASAAVRLGVTPSAVSQSIRRLEARLGIRLFVRTTRSVALTEAGDALVRQVKPALDQLSTADRMVADHQGHPTGRARISVSAAAMELLIAPILPGFRDAHPDFALEIVVEDRLADPVARRLDAVIRRGNLLEKDMIARRLSKDDRLVLVASESYLAHAGPFTDPHHLARHRILIRRPRSGAGLPWSLSRNRETVRIDGEVSLTVDSAIAARQFAIAGLGIALLAHEFVAAQVKAGLLHLVMPDWQQPVAGFHLMYVHRGNLPSPLWELERAIRQPGL